MTLSRMLLGAAVALTVLFAAGCVDNDIPENNNNPLLPGATDDPFGAGAGANRTGLNPDGAWVTGDSHEGALARSGGGKDWSPVDPGANLGFPVVYFAYDTDMLTPPETAKLDKVKAYLDGQAALGLIIEGHCDQRGTEEYNRALGERRANAIRAYLTERGFSDARIKTMSYGKDMPAVEGSGESVWSKNRRGVLVPAHMK